MTPPDRPSLRPHLFVSIGDAWATFKKSDTFRLATDERTETSLWHVYLAGWKGREAAATLSPPSAMEHPMTDFLTTEIKKAEALIASTRGPIRGWMGSHPFTTAIVSFCVGVAAGVAVAGLFH